MADTIKVVDMVVRGADKNYRNVFLVRDIKEENGRYYFDVVETEQEFQSWGGVDASQVVTLFTFNAAAAEAPTPVIGESVPAETADDNG